MICKAINHNCQKLEAFINTLKLNKLKHLKDKNLQDTDVPFFPCLVLAGEHAILATLNVKAKPHSYRRILRGLAILSKDRKEDGGYKKGEFVKVENKHELKAAKMAKQLKRTQ